MKKKYTKIYCDGCDMELTSYKPFDSIGMTIPTTGPTDAPKREVYVVISVANPTGGDADLCKACFRRLVEHTLEESGC